MAHIIRPRNDTRRVDTSTPEQQHRLVEHRCAELGRCLGPTQVVEVSHHGANNALWALVQHRQRRLHALAISTRCLASECGKAGQEMRPLLVRPGHDGPMPMQAGEIQDSRMKAVVPLENVLS